MNIGVILAGGTGTRVGAGVPKQFIKVQGKPILAYTLEIFQNDDNIDAIEVVCHKDWVDEVEDICHKYRIDKKKWTCTGGTTFQESTMNGIFNLKGKISKDDIVVRGETIAAVGSTGRSTGNHLHFSVRKDGAYTSPWNYLSQ